MGDNVQRFQSSSGILDQRTKNRKLRGEAVDLLLELMEQSRPEVAGELEDFCNSDENSPVLGQMIHTKLREHGIQRIPIVALAEMLQEGSGLAAEEAVNLIDGFLRSEADATKPDQTVDCVKFFAWLFQESGPCT